jgi:hypothetical protein
VVEVSWATWVISVAAVVTSALLAWMRGDLRKRPGLDMGFANHGGMWGDLVLLPIANSVIVPHLRSGIWIAPALALCSALSVWVHVHWYRGDKDGDRVEAAHSREHMWPSRPWGLWWKDLSWAGWAHVAYVTGELALLIGFLLFPMPDTVVALVCVLFTLHVPLGLLQPRWFLTGELVSPRKQPLLLPLLATLWLVTFLKFQS